MGDGGALDAPPLDEEPLVAGVAKDFFAALKAREAVKPEIGTMHATGKAGVGASGVGIAAGLDVNRSQRATGMGGGAVSHDQNQDGTGQWACHRCGKKNGRNTGQCQGCRALKRMNNYL